MKIISYNVNGIRAAIKKGFLEWLKAANPDIICIQETKANKEQVPSEGLTWQVSISILVFCAKKRLFWSCNFL